MVPDLITFAKGSNSGYVPVGGVIISDEIAATFDDRVFPGGLTYSGHPLACASDRRVDRRDEGRGHRGERGHGSAPRCSARDCASWPQRHPVIGEVRGLAVFWALDLVSNRDTRAMLAPYGGVVRGDERAGGRSAGPAG